MTAAPMAAALARPRCGVHLRADGPVGRQAPGLLLDRDGVLVDFVNYLHDPGQVSLASGVHQLLRRVHGGGGAVGVATNQAGIDRGLYGWSDYLSVEQEIDLQLRRHGQWVDGVAACPHHPDFTPSWSDDHAYWRKPGPGMLELLAATLGLEAASTWMIGDDAKDIEAARAAGLAGGILLSADPDGPHSRKASACASRTFKVAVASDIRGAMECLERSGFPLGPSC